MLPPASLTDSHRSFANTDFSEFKTKATLGKMVPDDVYRIVRVGFDESWLRAYKAQWIASNHYVVAGAQERMRQAFSTIGHNQNQPPSPMPSSRANAQGAQIDTDWFNRYRPQIIMNHFRYFPDDHVRAGVNPDSLLSHLDRFYSAVFAISWREGWVRGVHQAQNAFKERNQAGFVTYHKGQAYEARTMEQGHVDSASRALFGVMRPR